MAISVETFKYFHFTTISNNELPKEIEAIQQQAQLFNKKSEVIKKKQPISKKIKTSSKEKTEEKIKEISKEIEKKPLRTSLGQIQRPKLGHYEKRFSKYRCCFPNIELS